MAEETNGPSVNSLQDLNQIAWGAFPAVILRTAIQYDVFSIIEKGKYSVQAIAGASECSERGTRILLDALVGIGLLSKLNGKYELLDVSRRFLVKDSPDYMGGMYLVHGLEALLAMPEVVKRGSSLCEVEREETANQFFPQLVSGLHVSNREPAENAADVLLDGKNESITVLDVAAGSGIWGIAIAQKNPNARVTAHDFEAVLDTTRKYVEQEGCADQFDYLAGNLREVDFGENEFDVALLGNIAHSEGEKWSKHLFARIHRALKPGGKIVIIDMIPNEERTGPPFALIFAANMLLHTEEGDTFTLEEYSEWLREAHFENIQTADIALHSPLIIAEKA